MPPVRAIRVSARPQRATQRRVLGPGVEECLLPSGRVTGNRKAVVDRPTLIGGGVATLVVSEEEVCDHQVASSPRDGDLRAKDDGRVEENGMAARLMENLGSAFVEEA